MTNRDISLLIRKIVLGIILTVVPLVLLASALVTAKHSLSMTHQGGFR